MHCHYVVYDMAKPTAHQSIHCNDTVNYCITAEVDDISDDYEALLHALSAPCSLHLHHYTGLVVRIKLHQLLLNHCAVTLKELYNLI